MTYQASPIKRRRATRAEMVEREFFLIAYAQEHRPVTVRQLFYAATVAGVPGIDKTEDGYSKIQSQVLKLRQEGRMPYECIADATRYAHRTESWDGPEDALRETARLYRKSLWSTSPVEVEIWIEKDALAGVLFPTTSAYDVALMPTRGYTSETFAWGAVNRLRSSGKGLVVHALYDFDRSGQDAQAALSEKVHRFGRKYDVPVEFHTLGLTFDQVTQLNLPTRPPKRETVADKRWPHEFAAELDALPPDVLRKYVSGAIERHLPASELEALKRVEAAERETLVSFLDGIGH